MSEERDWVVLCECWDMAELQTLRASLEAHGVPVQVQGQHTYGVLGSIQAAAMHPRVLVPRVGLAHARELMAEIMPVDEGEDEDDEAPRELESPYRKEPSLPEREVAVLPRPKSWAVLALIGIIAALNPIKGLAMIYAGMGTWGGLVFVANLFFFTLFARGEAWAIAVQAILWLADMGAATRRIRRHNAEVAEQRDRLDALERAEEEDAGLAGKAEEDDAETDDAETDDAETDDAEADDAERPA